MDLDMLARKLISTRVKRVEGRDDGGTLYLSALVFDDGTILRFRWAGGIADEVGIQVAWTTDRQMYRIC